MKTKFTRTGIQAILANAGTDTDKARKSTALIIEGMAAALADGRTIELRGLGTFEQRERKACTRYNPKNMEPVQVPARRVIFFRPCGSLKKAMNEGLK